MTAMNTLIVALSRQIGGTRTIEEVDELELAMNALATTERVSHADLVRVSDQIQSRRKHIERISAPPVISAETRYSILVPRRVGLGWEFHTREGMSWEEALKERDHLRTTGRTNIKIVLVTAE